MLLPILAFACIVADRGPVTTFEVLLALTMLAMPIDAVGPRVGRTRDAAGWTDTALLFAAPLLKGALLVYALWLVSATPKAPMAIAMIAVMIGVSGGTVGISSAHELVHRRGWLERAIAQAFMLLVSYPHFPIVHLRVHHPYVGTPLDPGTSRLDEPLAHFVGRAFFLAWQSAWRVKRSRLARKELTAWRMDNAIVLAAALQAAVYIAVGTAFGWIGWALFFGQRRGSDASRADHRLRRGPAETSVRSRGGSLCGSRLDFRSRLQPIDFQSRAACRPSPVANA